MRIAPSTIFELRQYLLNPGTRETLIELFDREFVETQEAVGMEVVGQFRDLDRLDYFVWLRGFADMDTRGCALAAFYGGPVWKAHRDAANATMIDSDNVLLLRPAQPGSGFSLQGVTRALPGVPKAPANALALSILYLDAPVNAEFLAAFDSQVRPELQRRGAPLLATLVTESAENNFPALPVRTGENVFICLSSSAALDVFSHWPASLARRFRREPEILRLTPTARSKLRA